MRTFTEKKRNHSPGQFALFLILIIMMAFLMGCQQEQLKNPTPADTKVTTSETAAVETLTPEQEKTTIPEKSGNPEELKTPERSGTTEKPLKQGKEGKEGKEGKVVKASGELPVNPYEPPPNVKSAAPAGMLTPENLMLPLKTGFDLQRARAQFLQCQSNEKNIGTALEMYYTDHGRFPDSISELSPEYLITIPKCAAASNDTYSDSYVTNGDKTAFFFCCKGEVHKDMGAPANFPRFDSKEGLLLPTGYEETLSPEMKLFRCESNLRTISNAIEMYSTDHKGKYPEKLNELVPDYLPKIPRCPSAGKDTYSPSYLLKKEGSGESYNLFCLGSNHTASGLGKDFPRYEYSLGTVKEKPGLTEDDKKRIKQREAMRLLGDAMTASVKKDNKRVREILEKVKKMNVLDDKFTQEQIYILEKKLENAEKKKKEGRQDRR